MVSAGVASDLASMIPQWVALTAANARFHLPGGRCARARLNPSRRIHLEL
jgi:hypothetical protein